MGTGSTTAQSWDTVVIEPAAGSTATVGRPADGDQEHAAGGAPSATAVVTTREEALLEEIRSGLHEARDARRRSDDLSHQLVLLAQRLAATTAVAAAAGEGAAPASPVPPAPPAHNEEIDRLRGELAVARIAHVQAASELARYRQAPAPASSPPAVTAAAIAPPPVPRREPHSRRHRTSSRTIPRSVRWGSVLVLASLLGALLLVLWWGSAPSPVAASVAAAAVRPRRPTDVPPPSLLPQQAGLLALPGLVADAVPAAQPAPAAGLSPADQQRLEAAVALLKNGQPRQALRVLDLLAQQHSDAVPVQLWHAVALVENDRRTEAIAEYEAVLALAPGLPMAANNLAMLLSTHPDPTRCDPARAVALAQQACAATAGNDAGFLDTLAVAYAAAGDMAEALRTARQARDRAAADGQSRLVRLLEGSIRTYEDRRAAADAAVAVR